MIFVLGIDIGSASSKGIVLGDQRRLWVLLSVPLGGDFKLTAERIRKELLSQTGMISGGYFPDGRHRIWIKIGDLCR